MAVESYKLVLNFEAFAKKRLYFLNVFFGVFLFVVLIFKTVTYTNLMSCFPATIINRFPSFPLQMSAQF